MPSEPKPQLIPPSGRSPWMLALVLLLPQLLLLLFNLRGLSIIRGEMKGNEFSGYAGVLGCEAVLLLGGLGLLVFLLKKGWELRLLICIPLLLLHIAYLWLITHAVSDVIPDSVALWIFPPDRWLGYQFTFMMPVVFYGTLRLACFPMPGQVKGKVDLGLSLALAVGVPGAFYVVFWILSRFVRWHFRFFEGIFFFAAVVATVVAMVFILRLLALLHRLIRNNEQHGQMILGLLIGVVAPIGGLILNRGIPFPVDFQSPGLYALTLLNGLLLMLPRFRSATGNRVCWFALCALYPFSVYFFIVFLPWLPLTLLAMLVAGAGLLMLAPTALVMIQGLRIWDGFKAQGLQLGKPNALLLMLLAFALLPLGYTGRALMHKQSLQHALDYVYEADALDGIEYPGSRPLLKRTLVNLKAFYEGVEYPYLSEYYNHLVFGGLVLPEKKMNHLHDIFFGGDVPEPVEGEFNDLLFSNGNKDRGWRRPRLGPPPPTSATLDQLTWSREESDGIVTARAKLRLKAGPEFQTEYVTTMDLPPGVFVSGYALKVGEEWVPGRIFEKKTALWVYRMIRDSERRDPGLMTYLNDQQIQLRVFPFARNEVRETEIAFSYPVGLQPRLKIESHQQVERPRSEARASLVHSGQGGALVLFPETRKDELPRLTRKPYIHALIDASRGVDQLDWKEVCARIREVAAQLPDPEGVRVTLAHYNVADLSAELIPVADLPAYEPSIKSALPGQGGLFQQRAVEHALRDYEARAAASLSWAFRRPVLMLISDDPQRVGKLDLDDWSLRIPDLSVHPSAAPVSPVALLRGNEVVKPLRLVGTKGSSLALPHARAVRKLVLEVYDPDLADFRPLSDVSTLRKESTYTRGVEGWLQHLRDQRGGRADPEAALKEQVQLSRDSGILLPETAYIVVENSAQWQMLKLKEKQKLGQSEELEFTDAPEPTLWLLLGFAVYLLVRRSHEYLVRSSG